MKWFKLTNIFFKWVAQRYQHLLIHHISKEVTCHTVGGLIGRPKLMIFLGIILFLMHVSSLHIFLSITQLLFIFEFLHVPSFFPMTTFFFFPENRNHLKLTGRFDASSSTIRQAIRIKLLELHRYAIHQVLVDWMSWKCVATMFFLTFCISLKTQDIFLISEKSPYGRNRLQTPCWPRWLVACACSWCRFRCCLVSPPYLSQARHSQV